MPGGQGVFPSLTVRENLRVAGWLERKDADRARRRAPSRCSSSSRSWPQRIDEPATNLSGGQQQMLALGMAFLARPRLLLIDELSLGLAPVVVEQLLPMVAAIREQGTTVILVEQSVNLALTIAETAYFMEKGEIRFHGPTASCWSAPTSCARCSSRASAASAPDGARPVAPMRPFRPPTQPGRPASPGSRRPAATPTDGAAARRGG